MSKQDIKMVREFNSWRRGIDGGVHPDDKSYAKRLGEALDSVVKMAERYELVRTLNVEEFKALYKSNIAGYGNFDGIVDSLIEARKYTHTK